MIYKKLTSAQRRIKHWRERRNRLVGQLLADDPILTGVDALKLANRLMRGNQRKTSETDTGGEAE
jgi:hypothetical protein